MNSELAHMRRHTVPTLLCAGLLLLSALVRALLEWIPFVTYFPYFMWVHVAVLVLAFYGFWVLRKADSEPLGGFRVFVRCTPVWLAALLLPVAFAFVFSLSSVTSSLGNMPDGQPVHSKSWVPVGGRNYVVLNRTVKVEITDAEYTEAHREMYVAFSSGWILFSYLALVLWHYNRHREGLRQC